MRFVIIALMMLLLLTACSQGSSRALPDVVKYHPDTQRRAAEELRTQKVPTLSEMMKDYKVMRDQTRSLRQP